MAPYKLAKHAFMCRVDDQLVFLDLRHDEYLAVPTEEALTLRTLISGFPEMQVKISQDPAAAGPSAALLLRTLTERGLLVDATREGKPALPPAIEAISAEPRGMFGQQPSIRWAHVWRFVLAWMIANAQLRIWSIEYIVRRAERRKRLARLRPSGNDRSISHRGEEVEELVGIFYRLRPFLFTATEACLLHSLVLIEFLSRFNVYPTWTFGVKTRPFAAHCWLQEGSMILNGSAQYARKFIPIMAI
jgi:hypothetical protein